MPTRYVVFICEKPSVDVMFAGFVIGRGMCVFAHAAQYCHKFAAITSNSALY